MALSHLPPDFARMCNLLVGGAQRRRRLRDGCSAADGRPALAPTQAALDPKPTWLGSRKRSQPDCIDNDMTTNGALDQPATTVVGDQGPEGQETQRRGLAEWNILAQRRT